MLRRRVNDLPFESRNEWVLLKSFSLLSAILLQSHNRTSWTNSQKETLNPLEIFCNVLIEMMGLLFRMRDISLG